jgi:hypothetical protein
MSDAVRRFLRTVAQLIAGGGLTWLTDALVKDIDPQYIPYVLGTYTSVVVLLQNWLEDNTAMPAVLKAPASSGENPAPADAGTIR